MDILELKNVWIDYKEVNAFSYRDLFKRNKKVKKKAFTAVKDVSFTLTKGECLGIIGANGSGKSTLLRAIANIYEPDKGQIIRHCERTSLLSLGIGFQSRLSGRQNIMISGLAMGFTKQEINRRQESIIAFAELEEFIDKPVKTYSSGMYSKLAFSISATLKTELLLIDEVLSVGDIRFKKKSYERLHEIISRKDQSVVIVSHDESAMKTICDRVAWLDHGELIAIGDPVSVINEYKLFMNRARG